MLSGPENRYRFKMFNVLEIRERKQHMPFQFIQMVNPIVGSIPIAVYKSGNELAGYCQNRISRFYEIKYSQPLILSNVIFYWITYA